LHLLDGLHESGILPAVPLEVASCPDRPAWMPFLNRAWHMEKPDRRSVFRGHRASRETEGIERITFTTTRQHSEIVVIRMTGHHEDYDMVNLRNRMMAHWVTWIRHVRLEGTTITQATSPPIRRKPLAAMSR
jgi:hypothetical protein